MTLTFAVCRVVAPGGMAAERSFDRGGIEFVAGVPADRRVSRTLPLHAERFAQPGDANMNEAVDCPIRVGAGDDSQDRKQHDVRQAIQLPAPRPPRYSISVSRSTNELNGAMATPCAVLPGSSKGVEHGTAWQEHAATRRRFVSQPVAFRTHQSKTRSLNSPGPIRQALRRPDGN